MIIRFFQWSFHLVEGLIAGVWLLFLYLFTIWIVVGSLSAIQMRQDLSDANQSFTFTSVTEAKQRYGEQLSRIIVGSEQQAQAADRGAALQWQMQGDLKRIATAVDPKLNLENYYIWDYPQTSSFVQRQEKCRVLGAEAGGVDPVCTLIANYSEKEREISGLNPQDLSNSLDAIHIETQSKIDSLQKSHPLLKYYPETEFWNVVSYQWLLYMPQQVLVLFLTGAMGMLGSVITMTWSYVREDGGLTLRRFLVLPLVGSMSAFIILIFVSAGQLTLTSGADNNDLNPFTLSFLAIISGLLSERAYTRMADVGSNFFRVDDGQPRWANGLKEAMATAGVSTADLARHLYIAEEEAGRIVNETVTATLDQQRLIAACLRVPVRDIFTDVPPEGAATVAATTVAAPDLSGMRLADAEAALNALGLRKGAVAEALHDTAEVGVVIAQIPEPDTRLPKGGTVAVTLAAARLAPPAEAAAPEEGGSQT